MTIYYVDPSAGYNGVGSKVQPYNTLRGVSLAQNDTLLIKTGTRLYECIGKALARGGVTVASYGDGDKPILDGGIVLDNSKATLLAGTNVYAWPIVFSGTEASPTVSFNDATVQLTSSTTTTINASKITYRPQHATSNLGCELGNVTQDDQPLFWVPWAGDLQSTINNTPNSGQNNLPNKFNQPGRFTIDPVNRVVFVIPRYGLITGSEFKISSLRFGVQPSSTIDSTFEKMTIKELDLRHFSRHAIVFSWVRGLTINDIDMRQIGGEKAGVFYMGNGIELSNGTEDSQVFDCQATDIFDSAYSAQTYESQGSSIRRQDWSNLKATRTGMAAVEISIQNSAMTGNTYKGSAHVEHINVYNLTHDNKAYGWGGERGCHGYIIVNNGDNGCILNNIKLVNANLVGHGTGKALLSSRTGGANYYAGATGGGYAYAWGFYGAMMQQVDALCQCNLQGPTDIGSAVTVKYLKQIPM